MARSRVDRPRAELELGLAVDGAVSPFCPSGRKVGVDPTRPGARRHGPGRALRAAAAGILAVALVGCGDTDGSDAGPSPDVAGTGLAPDDLGAIPRPGQAEPVNAATEQGGAIAQTFELPGQQPQQILATFAELLTDAGWTETRAPEPYGTEGWRGE